MSRHSSSLDEVALSDLIGDIYDCVIDPARWEPTLDRLRELLDCANCLLAVCDYHGRSIRLQKVVGIEQRWLARMTDYGPMSPK